MRAFVFKPTAFQFCRLGDPVRFDLTTAISFSSSLRKSHVGTLCARFVTTIRTGECLGMGLLCSMRQIIHHPKAVGHSRNLLDQ